MDNLPILIRELEKSGYSSPLPAAKSLEQYLLQFSTLEEVIEKIRIGMPWEYIVGFAEFKGNNFKVNRSTLIPRVETEKLVELVATAVHEFFIKNPDVDERRLQLIDIGTGSGCIIISLKKHLEDDYAGKIDYFATDISEDALEVAKENAISLFGSDYRINFIKCDILPENLDGLEKSAPAFIVSNPPYIPTDEYLKLDKSVLEFEPRGALDGGTEGIDPYVKIFERTKEFESIIGAAFEIDPSIVQGLTKLYPNGEIINDQNGLERYLIQ